MIASLFHDRVKETKDDNELSGFETPRQLALMINDIELELKCQLSLKESEKESLMAQLHQSQDIDEQVSISEQIKKLDQDILECQRSRHDYAK
jgi:hypothetical protein